ncbi:hypothetical protein HOLleu_17560 [Holothuria leucospilota]|uniref:Uncharacterized protein n=1 Tax=Holothuria leucospilota TaxID=206669 RepID=A0A9Q1H8V4_HOLLE|nr:hypothetical protein HOLleu_17560 [Holothuria leucospilota]
MQIKESVISVMFCYVNYFLSLLLCSFCFPRFLLVFLEGAEELSEIQFIVNMFVSA